MTENANMQETTPVELSRDEMWAQIVSEKPAAAEPETEPTPETEPKPEPVVVQKEAQPVEAPVDDPPQEQTEIERPQADPKLAKRFRDSQEFIAKLKKENKAKDDLIEQLQAQLQDSQTKSPRAEEQSAPRVQAPTATTSELNALLQEMPEDVREELEAFPELLRGMNTLFDKRIQQMQSTVNPEIEEFRKERQKRQVRQALDQRHRLANQQLGITNSSKIDFDSPVFAQWVLANDWRKEVVTNFNNPQGFVDLLRGFLFEYPDEASRMTADQPPPDSSNTEKVKAERRKTASTVVSRKASPERPKPKVNDPESKAAFWASLTKS